MYGAEQGREKRDVSWTAQAAEWGFPSSVAMKMPQRQPWGDGKGKCLEDRSVPSLWALLSLRPTFRWTLPGATEHLGPQCQRFWEQGLGCQELKGLKKRRVWVMILGKAGLGGTCLSAWTVTPSPVGKRMLRVGES